jgi:hypothetical protein
MISKSELKTLGTELISDIEHDKEPVELMKTCVEIVDSIISGEKHLPDENTSNYFYMNFLYEIVKVSLKSTHYKDQEVMLG